MVDSSNKWVSERKMSKLVRELLKPLAVFRVESAVAIGCPDLCTVAGFVELKVAQRQMNPESIVPIDLRPSQRVWLKKWRRHGGRAWVLTKMSSVWLLHDGMWAADHLGRDNETTLIDGASQAWEGVPTSDSLIKELLK